MRGGRGDGVSFRADLQRGATSVWQCVWSTRKLRQSLCIPPVLTPTNKSEGMEVIAIHDKKER